MLDIPHVITVWLKKNDGKSLEFNNPKESIFERKNLQYAQKYSLYRNFHDTFICFYSYVLFLSRYDDDADVVYICA